MKNWNWYYISSSINSIRTKNLSIVCRMVKCKAVVLLCYQNYILDHWIQNHACFFFTNVLSLFWLKTWSVIEACSLNDKWFFFNCFVPIFAQCLLNNITALVSDNWFMNNETRLLPSFFYLGRLAAVILYLFIKKNNFGTFSCDIIL